MYLRPFVSFMVHVAFNNITSVTFMVHLFLAKYLCEYPNREKHLVSTERHVFGCKIDTPLHLAFLFFI